MLARQLRNDPKLLKKEIIIMAAGNWTAKWVSLVKITNIAHIPLYDNESFDVYHLYIYKYKLVSIN